ncbi:hypothetical protein ABZP36_025302 [Zizania latifolia]
MNMGFGGGEELRTEYHEGVRAMWLAEKAGNLYHHPYDLGVYENLVSEQSALVNDKNNTKQSKNQEADNTGEEGRRRHLKRSREGRESRNVGPGAAAASQQWRPRPMERSTFSSSRTDPCPCPPAPPPDSIRRRLRGGFSSRALRPRKPRHRRCRHTPDLTAPLASRHSAAVSLL